MECQVNTCCGLFLFYLVQIRFSLFTKHFFGGFIAILVYVDDLVLRGDDLDEI